MPYSYTHYKQEIRDHIVDNFPASTRILDVGAGCGTYGALLKPHFEAVDALEIFPDYVENFGLRSIYSSVHIGDILSFDVSGYDYIVMGDVVEHLRVEDAVELLRRLYMRGKHVMMAVPYMFEQGEEYGNVHETHHQPDLTVSLVYRRYPSMRLLYGDSRYGYFINYIPPIK